MSKCETAEEIDIKDRLENISKELYGNTSSVELTKTDIPEIEVELVHAKGYGMAAYGAKGVGELCTIPTAPAVAHAYYKRDGIFRTALPLEKTAYRK